MICPYCGSKRFMEFMDMNVCKDCNWVMKKS